MFKKPTVIILGAGASAPFGFPLGDQLRRDLISGIQQLKGENALEGYSASNAVQFIRNPFLALASYASSPLAKHLLPEALQNQVFLKKLLDLESKLFDHPAVTIDQFIGVNPSFQFIGKVLLSMQIMLKMYREVNSNNYILKTFGEHDFGSRLNWYGQLVNHLQKGAESGIAALKGNKLQIITFNYDQSLERALRSLLGLSENHQGADYREVLEIFHVNGTPETLPDQISNAGEFIFECAQNFHLVAEDVESGLEQTRAKARSAIANAASIYVMGFHFDQENVNIISLQGAPNKERIYCLNFDGNAGVAQRIRQLGIPASNIWSDDINQFAHIDEAISNGFLEQ